jgi:glycosyltransferase involved in cell wall biosynthesis
MSQSLKALHICSGNLYGGVEAIQMTLARYREQSLGVDWHFAVCFEGRLSRELKALGVPVHMLSEVQIRNPLSVWRARRQLSSVLSEGKYDVAISHSAWAQVVFGQVVRTSRIPLVFWLHSTPRGRHWLERWAKRIRPDHIISCGQFAATFLPNLYPVTPKRVLYAPVAPIIENTVLSGERGETRRELNVPSDAVVIIQVSRMEGWKGHKPHLEALGMLSDIPNWVCWIVGGAQKPEESIYLDQLRNLAAQKGIAARVHFLGDRRDVPRLLMAADLFCQPNTIADVFPIALIEALSAGLPIVTSDIGGGKEIVTNNCGALVEAGDVQQLAGTLRNLIINSDARLKLADAAAPRYRDLCEPSKQLEQLAVFLRTVITSGAEIRTGR